VVIAKSFARIHWQNLINFGVLPLTFVNPADYDDITLGDPLQIKNVISSLRAGPNIDVRFKGLKDPTRLHHELSAHQTDILAMGGAINWRRRGS
jgi:aconitate hydratase